MAQYHTDLPEALKNAVAGRAQNTVATMDDQVDEEGYRRAIRDAMNMLPDNVGRIPRDEALRAQLEQEIFDRVAPGRLGCIEPLLAIPNITEIMVNGPDEVWCELNGKLAHMGDLRYPNDEAILTAIDRIAQADNKLCDPGHPLCDCVLNRPGEGCHQSRVNMTREVSIDHPTITIRKFRKDLTTLAALQQYGTLDDGMRELLGALVRGKMNFLIVGGTGTGKTTLLNACAKLIPDDERIITIEDTAELDLGKPHVLRMESREANAEGKGEITIQRLIKNALRQRPDRIIVGECRGAEALDMVQAMSTGHDGSIGTVHANSAREALDRLKVMISYGSDLPEHMMSELIAMSIDFIVFLRRYSGGRRVIGEVTEVQNYVKSSDTTVTEPIWTFRQEGTDERGNPIGQFVPTGNPPSEKCMEKFHNNGVDIDQSWFRQRRR